MAAKRDPRLRLITATRDIRRMPARNTPIPMPIFVGLSSGGVTIGLVALLECGVGDVVEFANAGKDAEGAGNSDVVEFTVAGKDVGRVIRFCSLATHPIAPKD